MPVEIKALEFERIGTGQTGACYRFHLEHEARAPKTVILKIAAGTPEQRERLRRGYRAEVLFYETVAPRSAVQTPACWYAAVSGTGDNFTLILEDADPAIAGEQERGCSIAEAFDALINLARLHASTWNADILRAEAAWLQTTPERAIRLAGIYADAVEHFLERYHDNFSAAEAATFRDAVPAMRGWLEDDQLPQVLIHGDYRLDNLLFRAGGDRPVLAVDWQTLEVGQPGRDVAYFIVTALDSDQRRGFENRLLAAYHSELLANGIGNYDLEACRLDYRRGALQAAFITIVGCIFATGDRSVKSDDMFLSMAHRAARAIRELDTITLVTV